MDLVTVKVGKMQIDFHYYATYAAAIIAGYSHEESMEICYSAQFVDVCSRTLLSKLKAPGNAATTQLQLELADARTDIIGLQDITRIWSSFHFLPYDLHAKRDKHCRRTYLDKYRLICNSNGPLVADTVNLAKNNSLQAVGIAMHVLADTWAHKYFAGTPSLVINNVNYYFYEWVVDGDNSLRRKVVTRHNPTAADDIVRGIYTASMSSNDENSIMNLGHGRAGHLPDYSFIRYEYMPAWGDYNNIIKDNPSDYWHAFCQMVYALRYLRGEYDTFELDTYDFDVVSRWEDEIKAILIKRQLDSSEDWKQFGEALSGSSISDFDENTWQKQYMNAAKADKDATFLGKFFKAAIVQKSMVSNRIFESGNSLAGVSVNFKNNGLSFVRNRIGRAR